MTDIQIPISNKHTLMKTNAIESQHCWKERANTISLRSDGFLHKLSRPQNSCIGSDILLWKVEDLENARVYLNPKYEVYQQ